MNSPLLLLSALSAFACMACQPRTQAARTPNEREATPEQVVHPTAPRGLRIIAEPVEPAAASPETRYAVLHRDADTDRYQRLPATLPHAHEGFVPRATHSAVIAGLLFEAVAAQDGTGDATDAQSMTLRVSARPSTQPSAAASPVDAAVRAMHVALPQPCTQTEPALLQADSAQVHALLRCPKQGYALLIHLGPNGQVTGSRSVPAAADATLYLHQPDGDYLAVARQVLRVPHEPADALPIIGTVPPPGGGSDTRQLVRSNDLLLILDGAAGRVIAMDAQRMGWRYEKRFYSQGTVTRMRAVMTQPDHLLLVTAEDTRQGTQLFATPIVLSDTSAQPPQRWLLGTVQRADHELLPIATSDGGGAALLYSRSSASGTALVMRRLTP